MILCCGEALIDMIPTTAEGEPAFRPLSGGSVFNSAIALGRLGVPVSFFSGLSDDLFGSLLQEKLRESHVDLSHAVISARPTTLAFAKIENGNASYFFYDENTAGRMLTEFDLPTLGPDIETLLFGGISLVSEPCGSAYESLLHREAPHRLIMVDPNIRSNYIQDAERHRGRLQRLFASSDIVKVSDDDLRWIAPEIPLQEAIANLLATGPKLVVLTSGEQGASAFWNGGNVSVPVVPVQVADTVGAGDTFNAGFLAALRDAGALSKNSFANPDAEVIADALAFAAKVASITVSRVGANPPWRSELI